MKMFTNKTCRNCLKKGNCIFRSDDVITCEKWTDKLLLNKVYDLSGIGSRNIKLSLGTFETIRSLKTFAKKNGYRWESDDSDFGGHYIDDTDDSIVKIM